MKAFKALLVLVVFAILAVVGVSIHEDEQKYNTFYRRFELQAIEYNKEYKALIDEIHNSKTPAPVIIYTPNPIDHDRLDVRIGQLEYTVHGKNGILAKLNKK